MPWMPEVFTTPIAAARRAQDEEATSTNDAVPYYEGILADEPEALVSSFAARQPVLDDPRVGYVEGVRGLRAFASGTAEWLRERDAVVENVALTLSTTRTVEEVVLNLLADDGARVELPVAVVSDRNAEGAPGEYQRALAEGDLEGIVVTFEADGYAREPSGAAYLHRGIEALRELYAHMFANAGGIGLEHCTLTDDGVRCAIEYNCVRWGIPRFRLRRGLRSTSAE